MKKHFKTSLELVFRELNGVGGTDNLDQLIITSKALGAFVISNFPDQENYKVGFQEDYFEFKM